MLRRGCKTFAGCKYASTRTDFYYFQRLLKPRTAREAVDKARALLIFRNDPVLMEVEECCRVAKNLDDGSDAGVLKEVKRIEDEVNHLNAMNLAKKNTFILVDKDC